MNKVAWKGLTMLINGRIQNGCKMTQRMNES